MYPRARSHPGRQSAPARYPGSFLLALREALAEMQWEPRRWLGLAVECTDAGGHEQVLGLENLYRRLRREERTTWPGLIVEMLRSVPPESSSTVNLNEVAERILLRLGPPFAPATEGKEIWYQPLVGKRLGVTLVVDYPNSMSYVSVQQIAESGQDAAVWLDRAVANLRGKTPENCVNQIHEESGLRHCEVGDAYDSSRAMLLDWMIPGHDDGFFVALPGRDQLLVLPVAKDALGHIAWLRALASRTHETVPYPISGEIFWVRQGVWRLFSVSIDKDQVIVTPPPEFTEVLQRLAPDFSIESEDSGEEPSEESSEDDAGPVA
ncbi:MAG: hypothetical protein L0Y71_20200 [Gemmataceae bacterium]|nr:hypothetical protein [Gemmataceae bacterium]